jgi:hypothetical protein
MLRTVLRPTAYQVLLGTFKLLSLNVNKPELGPNDHETSHCDDCGNPQEMVA